MELIDKKRFIVQFNRCFLQGSLKAIFLFSILVEVIILLWLPYDINKTYEGVNIRDFLVFLCIMVPRSYDTEKLKREISYFMSLNYTRKEYFKNKVLIINLILSTSIILASVIMFGILNYDTFGFLGFVMKRNLSSFLKLIFVSIVIYNLFYTISFIIQILFIRIIPNKIGNVICKVAWGIAFLIFCGGFIGDVYIYRITSPGNILSALIIIILASYYAYYKFIMSLDI